MTGLLADRVIVVTGGAQEGSIGAAIAERAAEEGAVVVVTSRRRAAAERAARSLARQGWAARPAPLDLASDASIRSFAANLLRDARRVDGVVHNAGAPIRRWDRGFLRTDLDDFRHAFEVDLLGAVNLSQRLLPRMVKQGSGSLVFTSSTAAVAGFEFLHEFAPAKAGVLGVMRGLAKEFGPNGIRSNAVAYGNIRSRGTYDRLTPRERRRLADESPLRRWGLPREAADVVVFLLSDLASFVNGQTLIVDGGTVAK